MREHKHEEVIHMKHFEMPKPPYLGAAYYPEDWDDDQIDVDVAKMVEWV